jgi:putative FmdB family regulatory protein
MPLYEYQCQACSHRFEAIQRFSDAPLEVCPKCGGAVRKLQSAPAFQFKGTGWYVTDYAKKEGPKEAPAATGSGGEAAKAPEKADASASGSDSPTKSDNTATKAKESSSTPSPIPSPSSSSTKAS